MIVIIPYKSDNRNGQELLYSIRSLVKHFRSLEDIIIAGIPPTWYKGLFLNVGDVMLRREYSMYFKTMAAAKFAGITEFLYTCDDHFCLKDFDDKLPNYYSQTCGFCAVNRTSGQYRKLYQACPPEWLNFDIHTPIVMKPFQWEIDRPVKTYYGNSSGVQGTELNDLKFYNGHSYDKIKSIIDEKPFFSTSPFSQNADMIRILKELYHEKSKYEK